MLMVLLLYSTPLSMFVASSFVVAVCAGSAVHAACEVRTKL
jgi:hypothetical protein